MMIILVMLLGLPTFRSLGSTLRNVASVLFPQHSAVLNLISLGTMFGVFLKEKEGRKGQERREEDCLLFVGWFFFFFSKRLGVESPHLVFRYQTQ